MKERPILFKGEMVRAILEGRKTQTRRLAKYAHFVGRKAAKPENQIYDFEAFVRFNPAYLPPAAYEFCPYGQPGDRLWVRETFGVVQLFRDFESGIIDDAQDLGEIPKEDPRRHEWGEFGIPYSATYKGDDEEREFAWHPSIHMPRWASRLNLDVLDVRAERLQDISEEDAIAEGIQKVWSDDQGETPGRYLYFSEADAKGTGHATAREAFRILWESINGPGSWDANPWVWVVEFRRLEGSDGG